MNSADIIALLPLILLTLTTIAVMLAISFKRSHGLAAGLTALGFTATFLLLPAISRVAPHPVTPIYLVDTFGLFFTGLLLAASLVVTLLAYGYYETRSGFREEFYLLLLMSAMGGLVLVGSTHLVSLFIGLELLSVPLYTMVGFSRTARRSLEAALKYLVLAGVSSAFLLFGMALLFAATGSMDFSRILEMGRSGDASSTPLMAGLALIGVAVGFKLAIVPFHLWTPDVYEGAPAPTTSFVATVSKGAMTAVLLRLYLLAGGVIPDSTATIFSILAILSMFTGNLLALMQNNVKRVLAYSSISHLGYLLVAFLAGGEYAVEAVTFYLTAYMVTSLGTFGIIALLSDREGEPELLQDYSGLFWRNPVAAGLFSLFLLSLAGIPMTAGFIGKFYLFAAGVDHSAWLLIGSLIINSAIGLFYYLRIVASMYAGAEEKATPMPLPGSALASLLVLMLVSVVIFWFGVYPEFLIHLIRSAIIG